MTKLRISEQLALPEDAVTRTFVVYGGKGKGKTNFGAVLCEELAARGLRFCVTDPLDVWWGLQHGRTKDEQGIDVVILGGQHADEAITPDAGEVIADFVADEPVNTVIVMRHADGRMWSNGERIRFMSKFTRRLFARQGERRIPLMLVIDEAGRFVPQIAPKGAIDVAECIGAIEELVEWGRNVGLGCCLITQRSARMNKSVSELAECMVAFQTAGPNSISAIVDWFGEHIEKARQNELIGILRKLPVGRALVVSPEWLDFEGEAPIRLRRTFDSSATPKAGGALRAPGRARKPDLAKYRARLAEVAERAKADDPKALRAQLSRAYKEISELQRAKTTPAAISVKAERVEIPVLKNGDGKRLALAASTLETLTGRLEKVAAAALAAAHSVHAPAVGVIGELARVTRAQSTPTGAAASLGVPQPTRGTDAGRRDAAAPVRAGAATQSVPARPATTREDTASGALPHEGPLPGPITSETAGAPSARTGITARQQRFLDAAATLETLGVEATRETVAGWLGVHPRGGSVGEELKALVDAGFIRYERGQIVVTPEGHNAAGEMSAIDAIERATRGLSPRQARIFNIIFRVHPEAITREAIAEQMGIHPRGGSFGEDLGRLRGRGLIEYARGQARARDFLFVGAAA